MVEYFINSIYFMLHFFIIVRKILKLVLENWKFTNLTKINEKTIATDVETKILLLLTKGLGRKYLLQCCCYGAIELQRHNRQRVTIVTILLQICNGIVVEIEVVL